MLKIEFISLKGDFKILDKDVELTRLKMRSLFAREATFDLDGTEIRFKPKNILSNHINVYRNGETCGSISYLTDKTLSVKFADEGGHMREYRFIQRPDAVSLCTDTDESPLGTPRDGEKVTWEHPEAKKSMMIESFVFSC